MSFAVPRNVPAFGASQRHLEDRVWGSNRGMELPTYKDKPFYPKTKRSTMLRKRFFGALLFAAATLMYYMGFFTSSNPSALSPGAINWQGRQDQVRDAFLLTWNAYEKYAWGHDEFHPVSKTGRDMVDGGLGWIIVDSLDTMILMNLTTQLKHAQDWISTSLDYDKDHDVNTFETTIRMLGGLLSAHYLSTELPHYAPMHIAKGSPGEDLYLEKASDLADRLLGAYESMTGIPYASINLKSRKGIRSHADGGASSTAEATTTQLEMKYLSKLTGETLYWEKAEKVMKVVDDIGQRDGLLPIFIDPDVGRFRDSNIRLGSRGDSYYEYLIKQYLQTSQQEPVYREMWDEALTGVRKHLITYSYPSNFTVLAERPTGLDGGLSPKMDHLVCFMPGTIALAVTGGLTVNEFKEAGSWSKGQEEAMNLAKELMKTCMGMYKVTPTGLAAEITFFRTWEPHKMAWEGWDLKSPESFDPDRNAEWRDDFVIKPNDAHNLLRPETVESLFYMWRITGDVQYRTWAWEIFQAFVEHAVVPDDGGFSSINSVKLIPSRFKDNLESFWLAETLKYLFLTFGEADVLPLQDVVFNTEGHPFPRFELGKLFKTGWSRKPRDEFGHIKPDAPKRTNANLEAVINENVKIQTVAVEKTPDQH
ncbi:hypothetical protein W97_08552 [Coniosporium apollinis CBS 100218]|uniref:alpha-1,2-Mannosidase n=1 Tax=Coniosporium apollinis (strain CBS 100218) TaxID=1168221 RepID=R7Z518_CONA1|nr:uncharacterized protein W97_08552 [Coniosporium apollinis CBS 100218]EON69193.1 hypothetical protein W97_08552 [Coniosporium apollinis CBS 100218]